MKQLNEITSKLGLPVNEILITSEGLFLNSGINIKPFNNNYGVYIDDYWLFDFFKDDSIEFVRNLHEQVSLSKFRNDVHNLEKGNKLIIPKPIKDGQPHLSLSDWELIEGRAEKIKAKITFVKGENDRLISLKYE